MKHIFIILFFCLSNNWIFAQSDFSLSLKLIKPSGRIDNSSYFEAKLQNHNDSLNFLIICYPDDDFLFQRNSYLRVIYSGISDEQMGNERPIWGYKEKKIIELKPDSTLVIKMALFFPMVGFGNGILPSLESAIQDFSKVRIKLEKFTFAPIRIVDNKLMPPLRTVDLYSNWVDIPQEEVIDFLRKHYPVK